MNSHNVRKVKSSNSDIVKILSGGGSSMDEWRASKESGS